ncbi:MAG: exodeoxyribonuclease V subunit alpha [Kiritimatiellaeota bacterium]|nr:exodeoxyribonuclease V subunit alpha [Kiritimatiellota bacterium]
MDFNVTESLLTDKLGLSRKTAGMAAVNLNLTVNDVLIARDLAEIAEIAEIAAETIAVPLLMLADSVNEGSVCLRLTSNAMAAKLAGFEISIGELRDAVESIPETILGSDRPLIFDGDGLYFQRHHKAAAALRTSLNTLIKHSERQPSNNPESIGKALAKAMDTTKYSLEPLQVLALASALLNDFQIISGGPGTGKTTIVLAYLRCLLRMGVDLKKVVLTAPTGRAAKRMAESIENGLRNDIVGGELDPETEALLALESTTMHKLLRFNPGKGAFLRNKDNRLRYEIIIVDEVSMVDISLMSAFMSALRDNCKLLLLGDQFQLPPVNAGAVLADLMPPVDSTPARTAEFAEAVTRSLPEVMDKFTEKTKNDILSRLSKSISTTTNSMTNHVSVLEVSKRFQKDIAELSGYVKKMDSAKVAEFLSLRRVDDSQNTKWSEIEGARLVSSNCDWSELVSSWVKDNLLRGGAGDSYAELVRDAENAIRADAGGIDDDKTECFRRLFARIAASRVLCLTYAGKFGTTSLNARISNLVAGELNETINGDMFSGMFVMILENSRRMNLYNGDIGVLVRHPGTGRLLAVFEDGNHFTVHYPGVVPTHRPAFAITVHKSQGSEFDRVLMPLPDNTNHRLLTREIVYTGLTRAKKAAVIVASDKALAAAVSRKTERFSGLALVEA